MIFVNKILNGGERYIIESDNDHPMQRIVLLPVEYDALAETLTHRLEIVSIERGSTGLVGLTPRGNEIHIAFTDEVSAVLKRIKELFPDAPEEDL